MGKTTRAIEARRLKFTDELLANVRQRFEHSDEPLSTMAADLGCCNTTLRGIAKREGWVRYVAPPRDLTPAAKLLAQAEALSLPPDQPPGGGEEEPPAETVEELHDLVRQELAAFKTQRAQLKGQPLGLLERERAARTLAGLTATLHRLQAMRCAVPPTESHNDDDYDDMPADLDAFRDELARRIDAFVASRADQGDAPGDAAAAVAAPGA